MDLEYSDLHLHLSGSITPEVIQTILGYEPSEDQIRFKERGGLQEALNAFSFTSPLLQTAGALKLAVLALNSNTYQEVRFSPVSRVGPFMTARQAINIVKVNTVHPLIFSTIHGMTQQQVEQTIDLALEYGAAVDLGGNEHMWEQTLPIYAPIFQHARRNGCQITIHAGETNNPQHIVDAIEQYGASRVGHGVCILNSEKATKLALERNIGIECCLTSNVQTQAIPNYTDHSLKAMLEAGLEATLCTDNKTFSNTTIQREYGLAEQYLNLNKDHLQQLIQNGKKHRFGAQSDN